MNFTDMLSYADIHDLSRIANNYECQCSSHSKNELIQSILAKIGRKEVFEQQVIGLTVEDIRFLNSILSDPRESFSLEELIARVTQTRFMKEDKTQVNPRDVIANFKRRGWLFNGYSQQTKYLFQIPNDLKTRFSDVLVKHFHKELVLIEQPDAYRDEQKLIIEDIYSFLRYIYHQEVALSAEGFMYKRFLWQILEGMSVVEEPMPRQAWRFGYGRRFKEYPNRFSFIYDYCYFHQLISESNQVLSLTPAGHHIVVESKKENMERVYRFWLQLYKAPIHNLHSIVHWIEQLSKQWVTVESLSNVLCRLIRPYYYDSPQAIFEQRIVQMMMHLGLLKMGEDIQYGKVLQISKLGSSVIKQTYVQMSESL